MSNIKDRGKGEGVKAKGAATAGGRLGAWRVALALTLCPFAFALSGCRMDMQDQPKYEAYESSRTFRDGQASRPLVEGTVARGHLREDSYFHTGKAGAGAAVPPGGAANVRANTGGGTPGAQAASAAIGGPDNFPLPLSREALER